MVKFGVQSTVGDLAKAFEKLGDGQTQFAISKAMNLAARASRTALSAALKASFDRPTPYTLNSLFTKNSTKRDLTVQIGHKQAGDGKLPASAYLQAEIEGGTRNLKSTELLVGSVIVPTKIAKLDAYGNIPNATMGLIRQAIQNGEVRSGNKTYVCVKPGVSNSRGLIPGVYIRTNAKVKARNSALAGGKVAVQSGGSFVPLVFFEPRARYHKRYDLTGAVWDAFTPEFERQLPICLDEALATAKVKL